LPSILTAKTAKTANGATVMIAAKSLISLAVLWGTTLPLVSQPTAPPENIFDIRRFGATGQRGDKATKPIQDAVDACFRAGAGVVYVPPGQYTTGAIQLKDNVNLHLEAGATL
jgi:polygalacturonase